jgi:rhodanese-related sulfurtransferase
MNNIKFLVFFIACLNFTACQDSSTTTSETTKNEASVVTYQRVANADFKKLMADMPNATLVDVRTPGEYEGGRIGHAQNIDFHGEDFKTKIDALDKSKPVLVYCQSGGRSKKACGMMKELGFTEIYELERGYGGWE